MKIISSKSLGIMPVYDLSVDHPDHSFVHSSGIVAHNCAWIISDSPISSFIPLTTVGGFKVTQFNATGVEAMGGLKMDFLVVSCLKDIQNAISLVQDRSNTGIDWASARQFNEEPPAMTINGKKVPYIRALPFNGGFHDIYDLPEDTDVFNTICESDTESVFQFNTDSAKTWLKLFNRTKYSTGGKEVKALDSIESLSAFTALDRPGPLDAYVTDSNGNKHNMLVEYSNRARGGESVGSNHYLNDALPETYGIIVYQEQLERMFKELGRTSAGEAEEFRRAIAKKDMKKVLKFKEIFMRCAFQDLGEKQSEELWDMFITFGQYGFNLSHSISYVTISYACAFLKHHYPLEWWTAVLGNADRNEIDEKFWPVCGHLIDLPDVRNSGKNFQIVGNRIKAPLSLLHGIGEKAHEQLTQYAPYLSIKDFCDKIQLHKEANATLTEGTAKDKKTGLLQKITKKRLGTSALNSRVVNTLIVSGAMDSLFPDTTKTLLEDGTEVELKLEPVDKILMFQDALVEATGKKIPAKAKKELIEQFKNLTDLKKFQLRKKVLPAYSANILPTLASERSGFSFKEGKYTYTTDDKRTIQVFGKQLMLAINESTKTGLAPLNGIEGSAVAYVVNERRFTYGDSTKKTAVEFIVDIEGERLKLVQWPDFAGKLPDVFDNNLNGAIVLLTLSKKNDKAIRLKELFLVEPGIDTKKLEEASPEPEESK